jgi:hypothetical protein
VNNNNNNKSKSKKSYTYNCNYQVYDVIDGEVTDVRDCGTQFISDKDLKNTKYHKKYCCTHKTFANIRTQLTWAIKHGCYDAELFYGDDAYCYFSREPSDLPTVPECHGPNLGVFVLPFEIVGEIIQPDFVFASYSGIPRDDDSNPNLNRHYVRTLHACTRKCIEGSHLKLIPLGIGAHINRYGSPATFAELNITYDPRFEANCELVQFKGRVWIKSLDKPIVPLKNKKLELYIKTYNTKIRPDHISLGTQLVPDHINELYYEDYRDGEYNIFLNYLNSDKKYPEVYNIYASLSSSLISFSIETK